MLFRSGPSGAQADLNLICLSGFHPNPNAWPTVHAGAVLRSTPPQTKTCDLSQRSIEAAIFPTLNNRKPPQTFAVWLRSITRKCIIHSQKNFDPFVRPSGLPPDPLTPPAHCSRSPLSERLSMRTAVQLRVFERSLAHIKDSREGGRWKGGRAALHKRTRLCQSQLRNARPPLTSLLTS